MTHQSLLALDESHAVEFQYLAEAVLEQFSFFRRAVCFLTESTDADLAVVVDQYIRFLTKSVHRRNGGCDESQDVPVSLALELVWRCHLLRPHSYKQACSALAESAGSAGQVQVLDHSPGPASAYCDQHTRGFTDGTASETFDSGSRASLGIDLVQAVRRQQAFMCKALMLLQPQIQNKAHAMNATKAYVHFLRCMRITPTIVPSFCTDLVWHTHMQFPRQYALDCLRLAGHEVDHDDEADTGGLPSERQRAPGFDD